MLDLSERIELQAAKFLRELGRQGSIEKTNSVHIDDYGQAHVKGGMFNATGGRDGILSLAGLEASDVAAFRRELKEHVGITLSQAQADGLLMEARIALANGTIAGMDVEKKRAYEREKKAKRRQWARDNGICIKCCKNAAADRMKDGITGATCIECQHKANEAKKRKRSA